MKLARLACQWYRQANRWALHLSPWRYSALIATGVATGAASGAGLGGASHAEVILSGGTSWLILLFVGRLIAPAALQQWSEERRAGRQGSGRAVQG